MASTNSLFGPLMQSAARSSSANIGARLLPARPTSTSRPEHPSILGPAPGVSRPEHPGIAGPEPGEQNPATRPPTPSQHNPYQPPTVALGGRRAPVPTPQQRHIATASPVTTQGAPPSRSRDSPTSNFSLLSSEGDEMSFLGPRATSTPPAEACSKGEPEGEVTWQKTVKCLTSVDQMSRQELVRELVSRSIFDTQEAQAKKSTELQALLKAHLHGIKRPQVLLFGCPDKSIESLNLDKYDILQCEPLHDVSNQDKHLMEELPLHVPPNVNCNNCL
ncbi:Hypp8257 [Branchiostoma lanceolatum]|uniref:Hypp8257 protein n=1 Tax=Branchiostoma lanceolatum TaxID=7740 RepID=A0A8K0EH18_BRALA|nr:Hypp8257 [Branchiostoma lanceolatum]